MFNKSNQWNIFENYVFKITYFSAKGQWVYSVKLGETKMCGLGIIASVNTWRPRQNGRHFSDDIFKYIFLDENVWITIKVSLMIVPKGPINNSPALIQIMAWRRSGDKPLSEPTMVGLPTHVCVTRPQWVNSLSLIPYQAITLVNQWWLSISWTLRKNICEFWIATLLFSSRRCIWKCCLSVILW